jgi:hypothetical protein
MLRVHVQLFPGSMLLHSLLKTVLGMEGFEQGLFSTATVTACGRAAAEDAEAASTVSTSSTDHCDMWLSDRYMD